MSHQSSQHKICPNCGYLAVENYCAQCGQETHLHKDTFWALISHFAGHYLHYDSKFWQTLRALWFSPGLLTKAYWEEKRMRYIPPISLYIFVSFMFFFINSVIPGSMRGNGRGIEKGNYADIQYVDTPPVAKDSKPPYKAKEDSIKTANAVEKVLGVDFVKLKQKHPDVNGYVNEQFAHLIPKIFFFLIPLMALMLKLFFFRRTDLLYVNHVIFSLHCHAFWFSLWILSVFAITNTATHIIVPILLLGPVIYLVVALRNVYNIKIGRSILYAAAILFFYSAFAMTAMVLLLLIVLRTA